MTDYYSILSRAVAESKPSTAQTRAALFERARQMLLRQIQDTPDRWIDAAAEAEIARFDAATDQIESEIATRLTSDSINQYRQHRADELKSVTAQEAYDDRSTFAIGRVASSRIALWGGIGVSVAILIAIAIFALRSDPSTEPGDRRVAAEPANRTASRPALPEGELEPGVDGGSSDAGLAYHLRRQAVYYRSIYSEGMLIVDRSQRFIYLVQAQSRALRYGIGVGGECAVSPGHYRIQKKAQWPDWTPTPALQRRYSYPARVAGGPGNPMGAAVMFFEDNTPAIHGTNSPNSIGQAPAIGCFRLVNDDVVDLEKRVQVGVGVVVVN